jgi:GNAT superfamily N-acetyltransferase
VIFEALSEACGRGELMLEDGALCRFHLRRDGTLTVRELLVLPRRRGEGRARRIITHLLVRYRDAASRMVAKCPADLEANGFWEHLGFRLARVQQGGRRTVNVWVRDFPSD